MDAKLNIVPFVSVDHMMTLVNTIGVERFLTELAGLYRGGFPPLGPVRQDAAGRLAQHRRRHRADADERRPALRLQIRQRPPQEHPRGPPDGDGLRRPRRCRQRLSDAPDRDDDPHRLAHGRHVGGGGEASRAGRSGHHGDHRQRRAVRVPGARLQGDPRHPQAAPLRHRSVREPQMRPQPRGPRLRGHDLRHGPGGRRGRAHHHDGNRRQAERDHPDRQHGRDRRSHQRRRRRLPRQDRAQPGHPAALRHLRRIPAADPHRGRDPAARPGSSRDRAVAGHHRAGQRANATTGRSPCSIPSALPSRISRRCATCATSSRPPASTRNSIFSPIPTSRRTCSACCCARRTRPG